MANPHAGHQWRLSWRYGSKAGISNTASTTAASAASTVRAWRSSHAADTITFGHDLQVRERWAARRPAGGERGSPPGGEPDHATAWRHGPRRSVPSFSRVTVRRSRDDPRSEHDVGHSMPRAHQALRRANRRGRLGPRSRARRGVRVPGSQRGGQDDDDPHAARAGPARRRRGMVARVAGSRARNACRQVGALVEEPAFYPWLSGRANLAILADTRGRALARCDRRSAAAGRHRRRRPPEGEDLLAGHAPAARARRRPARAGPRWCCSTSRPTGSIPAGIRELRDLLRHLAGAGTTVFLSSHLLGEVEQVCDRVAVIDRGRLVSVGRARPPRWSPAAGSASPWSPQRRPPGPSRARRRWTVTTDEAGRLLVETEDAPERSTRRWPAPASTPAPSCAEHPSLEERFLAITEREHRLRCFALS